MPREEVLVLLDITRLRLNILQMPPHIQVTYRATGTAAADLSRVVPITASQLGVPSLVIPGTSLEDRLLDPAVVLLQAASHKTNQDRLNQLQSLIAGP